MKVLDIIPVLKNILSFTILALFAFGCMPEKTSKSSLDPEINNANYKFILVRHAEKEAGDNPGLTDTGLDRSLKLAELLKKEDITAIFSTDYNRTKATVNPLAEASGKNLQLYTPMDEAFLPSLFDDYPKGGLFVIAGHSNTVPGLVNQLSGQDQFQQIDEKDYNNLFIVVASTVGNGSVIQLTY